MRDAIEVLEIPQIIDAYNNNNNMNSVDIGDQFRA